MYIGNLISIHYDALTLIQIRSYKYMLYLFSLITRIILSKGTHTSHQYFTIT